MQRVVYHRLATRIGGNTALQATSGATVHPPQQAGLPESSSPTHLAANEDIVDDWDFIHEPVSATEVATALNELTLTASQHTRARSEGNWSSSDSTDNSNINGLFAAAEYNNHSEGNWAPSDSTEYHNQHSAREQINDIVANVLNDPVAGPAICNALARDHAFRDIVNRYAPGTALPAPAQVLQLPGPSGWPVHCRQPPSSDSNPLDMALRKIVDAVVNAVCHLGNSVRRLPEDVNILLSGIISRMNATDNIAAVDHPRDNVLHQEDMNRRWEAAFKRVITAVAVAVIARRLVFKSFA